MRTTIEIADELAVRAKKAAVDRKTTLRALVEEGLRLALLQQPNQQKSPLAKLKGLGKESWKRVHPDEYVRELRKGWE